MLLVDWFRAAPRIEQRGYDEDQHHYRAESGKTRTISGEMPYL
jgi:hypothetical protein